MFKYNYLKPHKKLFPLNVIKLTTVLFNFEHKIYVLKIHIYVNALQKYVAIFIMQINNKNNKIYKKTQTPFFANYIL